ncbi:hypothetical protein [Dehalogenimonas alkenigignens]|uniref:YesK-like protein n=1 Tax=Dehalogenimonas alkenigignens TaxID=1217799 RepID=A0A0W0GJL1_9CHLR|nr:hypothetical protein [Dehalogenimonas alkenigignens]KTB48737.1 hypothetical protein DEALK_15840 [Dehalogenimonas alkenigignens]PVV84848.1 hypothetical protein DD509_00610 [Dehalogenimonas alkenigignens]
MGLIAAFIGIVAIGIVILFRAKRWREYLDVSFIYFGVFALTGLWIGFGDRFGLGSIILLLIGITGLIITALVKKMA